MLSLSDCRILRVAGLVLESVFNQLKICFLWPCTDSETRFLDYKFLSLVSALESYHRGLFGNKYYDVNRGKKKKYFLKKRLDELLEDLNEELRVLITNSPDSFTENVVITRNYYVHLDGGLKAKAMPPEKMYYVFQRLGLLSA